MDDRLSTAPSGGDLPPPPRPGPAWTALAALLWTLAVAGVLLAADRLALGPTPPRGWTQARALEALPADAGPVVVPAYLPDVLAWPPSRVLYHAQRPGQWWMEVAARRTGEPWLYLGAGAAPPALLPDDDEPGWLHLTRTMDGSVVRVVTRLPEGEATRILAGLEPARRGR